MSFFLRKRYRKPEVESFLGRTLREFRGLKASSTMCRGKATDHLHFNTACAN